MYYKIDFKTAPTCFGVTTQPSGMSRFEPIEVMDY